MDAMELTIFGDAFNALKSDFDQVLKHLLYNMEAKESEEAQMSIALKITLQKDTTPDHEITAYAAEREIVVPKFSHKIRSVVTIKDEKSGFLGGKDYELVWDKETSAYVLRPVKSAQSDPQLSLFDEVDDDEQRSNAHVDIPDIDDTDGYAYEGAGADETEPVPEEESAE